MDTNIPRMKISQSDTRYAEELKRILNNPPHVDYKYMIDCVSNYAVEQLNSKQKEIDEFIIDVLLSDRIIPAIKPPITKCKVRYRGLQLSIQDTINPLEKIYRISQRGKEIAKIVR